MTHSIAHSIAGLSAALAVLVLLFANQGGAAFAQRKPPEQPRRLQVPHLPNAVRLHPKVISGGSPDGQDGFRQLAKLGVKTVISVDGLTPDVASAKRFGLRYVHLPHGYDGIQPSRVRELAKAVHELPGPIYIHCHHGRHRSPAAAVSACITLGHLSPTLGVPMLKLAGTSPEYRGLYQSVKDAKRLPVQTIEAVEVQFRETVELPSIVEVMTKLESITERLERHRDRNWNPDKTDPDRTPAHDALLLQELFTEFGRDPSVRTKNAEFRKMVRDSLAASRQLRESLAATAPGVMAGPALKRIRHNCVQCHRSFRN